jgi:hypothetical protein
VEVSASEKWKSGHSSVTVRHIRLREILTIKSDDILGVASPDKILEWSFGEITKPETINYRTQRSEKSGLLMKKSSDRTVTMNVTAENTEESATRESSVKSVELKSHDLSFDVSEWDTSNLQHRCHTSGSFDQCHHESVSSWECRQAISKR